MSTTASISYQYADGSANTIRRTGVTYPNGRQVSYLYNGLDDRLSRVTALANSPLGQGMRSYWRLDENVTSGARFDSIGTNGLTDVNSNVGSASGLFGGKAAQFVAANSAVLSATALNGLIYNGQSRFTTAGWIKFNSVSGVIGLWGKGNSGNASYTQQEWMLYIEGNYIYWVLSDGTHSTVLNSNTYAATGQWYFVVAGYDYDAVSGGRAFVQIDNGTEYSTTSLGPTDRGNGFTIGRTYDHFLSGLVQSVGVWDRVLSSSERTALYNGGSGFDLQVHAKYTYLGLNTVVKVDYPQPAVGLDLATGSGANPYQGLDRFGRVVDNLWKQYATATTADEIKYGYDRNSNRTFRENSVSKGLSTPKYFDELYANDGLNRLQAMQRGQLTGTPPSGITNQSFGQAWMLDPTGNWGQFQEDATGGGTPTLDQTRVSNEVNEITNITNASPVPAWAQPAYDPAGNMTTVPQPADMTKKYTATFDAWNRLTKLVDPDTGHTVQENQYDGLTRRTVQKTYDSSGALAETRRYYYSSAWQVLEERLGTSTTPDRQFVWGLRYIDDLILRDRSVSGTLDERLFALQDANWNVTALVDTSGTIQQRVAYSPYGVPMFLNANFTAGSNAKDWETLFCGYRWDASSGLMYVRNRFFMPPLGCWLTHDLFYAINRFQLNASSPLNSIDPLGLLECKCCAADCAKLTDITSTLNAHISSEINMGGTLAEIRDRLAVDIEKGYSKGVTVIEQWVHDQGTSYIKSMGSKGLGYMWADCIQITCGGKTFCIGSDKIGHLFQQGYMLHEISKSKGAHYATAFSLWTEGLYYEFMFGLQRGPVGEFTNPSTWLALPGYAISRKELLASLEKARSSFKADPDVLATIQETQDLIDAEQWLRTSSMKFHGFGSKSLEGMWAIWGNRRYFEGAFTEGSYPDHAANQAGMRFWNDIDGKDVRSFKFDICKYVTNPGSIVECPK